MMQKPDIIAYFFWVSVLGRFCLAIVMCVFVHSFRNNRTQTKCLQIGWKIPREKLQSCSDPIRTTIRIASEYILHGQIFRTSQNYDKSKSQKYRRGETYRRFPFSTENPYLKYFSMFGSVKTGFSLDIDF